MVSLEVQVSDAVRSAYPTKMFNFWCSWGTFFNILFPEHVSVLMEDTLVTLPAHRKRRHREQPPAVKDSVMLFTSHPGAGLQHATTLLMGVRDRKKTICALRSVSKGGRQSAPMSDYFLHDPVCRLQPAQVKQCIW